MDNKKLDTLYDLCEMTFKEIEATKRELESAGGELNEQHVEYLKDLVETMKYIKCLIGMIEDEGVGYSGNYYYDDDMPMMRNGRRSNRNSYGRGRNSYDRGDYSRGRYSRDDYRGDFIEELEELMNKAPDEHTRKKFERLMAEMK